MVVVREKSSRRASKERLKAIFPDPDKVKEEVRQAITNPPCYDVESLYLTSGLWQRIVRSAIFKNVTFLVIVLNSMWIGIDTDNNKAISPADTAWVFVVVENLFCSFFAFEITARYMAFERKRDAFNDGWFLFDGSLSLSMVLSVWVVPLVDRICGGSSATSVLMQNTSVFRILRLFRVVRVGRVARLLRGVPELMVLVKGMAFAMRAVLSTLSLFLLFIYIFAIVFTEMLAGTEAAEGNFENVLQSMNCLLINGVFADQAALISKLLEVHWSYYVAILAYMVIGSLGLLNMLIGIMCEVVQMVSEAEKDVMTHSSLRDQILKIVLGADTDSDMDISYEEFKVMLQSPSAMQALNAAQVDVVSLVDYVDCIFHEKTTLGIDDFVDTVLQFRKDNAATVKDLLDVRRALVTEIELIMQDG